MAQYSDLNRAQLSYDYLHTNSTTHEFLFGGLAELVDNARDASATKINVYTTPNESLRGGFMLCFLDDGEGMDPAEALDIMTFGKSLKRSVDSQLIGMYGNGLKSGSMRIGNDLILFTKKGPNMTCVFLSRTFHEQEKIDEIVVPMPVFETTTKKPSAKTAKEKEKHKLEMDLILKYSPFKTEAQFMKEFDRLDGTSGSLIIIYNLKLLDSGLPELDIQTDPEDIILNNPPDPNEYNSDEGLMPERRSFRAYTSIMYVDPRMRIYIQNKKVQTKRLVHYLYKPRMYKYSSSRFKARSENEAKRAQAEANAAENRAREAESKAKNLENKHGSGGNKDQRADLRKAQTNALELRKEAQIKKQMAERKVKSLRDPKTLNFIFGININNRTQDGMFIYNCSRLIKMYHRVGPQTEGGVFCSGVLGIVDVPYLVLEPTHNKQDFADAKEFRHLQRAMGEYMVQYWKDVGVAQQGVSKFWENFGYTSSNWRDPPVDEQKFIRKRAMQLQDTIQCDLCLKWRILPFSSANIGKAHPDNWVCNNNTDPQHNRCSTAEQKLNIPEGVLKKETKTAEQKAQDLEEDIRKKQELLSKMQKTKTVNSSREAKKVGADSDSSEEEEESDHEERRKSTRRKIEESKPPAKEMRSNNAAAREDTRRAVVTSSRSSNSTPSRSGNSTPSRSAFSAARASSSSTRASSRNSRPSASPRRPVKHETDDSDDDDDDDDDDDEPPAKKKAPTPKAPVRPTRAPATPSVVKKAPPTPSRTPARTPARTPVSVDSEDSEPEAKKPRGRPPKKPATSEEESESEDQSLANQSIPDDGLGNDLEEVDVGTKVEARLDKEWFPGTISQINKRQGKWRVKFDNKSKGEKLFEASGSDVRLLKEQNHTESSHDGTNEIPTSSTVGATGNSASLSQITEDIAGGYRTCLRYFLPPQWVMDKDAVSQLAVGELATFPLDDFFDHYEKGLRKLVSSFQLEANAKSQEAEQAKLKLASVRKMISKLLKSINEEFDIDPECDSEQVDELLAACVKQAMQDQSSS